MKKTIFLLHGEDAVNAYQDGGVKACIKGGYNVMSEIHYTAKTSVKSIVAEVLQNVAGSLDTCIISKLEYDLIKKAF